VKPVSVSTGQATPRGAATRGVVSFPLAIFPGLTAGAPSKRNVAGQGQRQELVFPGLTAGAPLKQVRVGQQDSTVDVFPGLTAGAPLKPGTAQEDVR
jgi:hypothetical protein